MFQTPDDSWRLHFARVLAFLCGERDAAGNENTGQIQRRRQRDEHGGKPFIAYRTNVQ